MPFICPKCRQPLFADGGSLKCGLNHTYDISRRGYVNLLLSQESSEKRHGDSREMIAARTRFLDSGAYAPLCDAVCDAAERHASRNMALLDIGCGECYYTSRIADRIAHFDPTVSGIDISRDALIAGHRRLTADLAVASAYDLPIADSSVDVAVNIFAPYDPSELRRVIKSGGALIRVFPLERHLWELKQAIYDDPYENKAFDTAIDGFETEEYRRIGYDIDLKSNEQIRDLFSMTPYSYKTGDRDEEKLNRLNTLRTRVEFALITYTRK